MRERLIAALVGMTVAVIALYGVPRAYFLADLVQSQEERKIERSVELLSVLLAEREKDASPVTEEFLAGLLNEAEAISYVSHEGTLVTAGTPAEGDGSDIAMTRAVPGGGEVTVTRSGALIDRRVSEALMPLVLIGLGLTASSAAVGFLLARRLARPFQELASAATQLGRGRFDMDVPHYAVPEAEGIGEALRRGASQLEGLVRREREFAVNASHQLRTPITALRFELEDLAQWPETAPAVAAELELALTELDRLSEAITELLSLARGQRQEAATQVDVGDLVRGVVERWLPQARAQQRHLLLDAPDGLVTRLHTGPVSQILDVLVENALDHGRGDVTVGVVDADTHLQLRVADQGARAFDVEVFGRGVSGGRSTGLGLAVADELADAIGGRLHLHPSAHTEFVLRLPRLETDPASDSAGQGLSV